MPAGLDLILDSCQKFDGAYRADDFKESDHPRGNGGEFSSGGGGGSKGAGSTPSAKAAGASASPAGKSKAPFVNDFMKEHKSREQDLSRLSGLSDEKLNKALALIEKHNVNDEDAKYMKGLIRETLKSGPNTAPTSKPSAAAPKTAVPKSDPTTEGYMRTSYQR